MLGAKTQRLEQLKDAGFLVPDFVAITTEEIGLPASELAENASKKLKSDRFAVRSSALAEDTNGSSLAGQFMTKLAVSRDDLAGAIEEVRADALNKLGTLNNFSLIVQEFIEPDWSGVTFTRDPFGDREVVVEYHRGRGDAVVGGEIKPKRLAFYRTQSRVDSELPNFRATQQKFLDIEKLFDAPQDIEWCVKDGQWYWLQSRPITSLSSDQVSQIERLEQKLPAGKFYFAKTEICDVAPRPTPETFRLLEQLYADDGPVDRVYKKFGIDYHDTKFFKTILGDLYVDRERELQSLMPAYSYFIGIDYRPKPARLKGFLTSLRNARRFNRICGDREGLSRDLEARLVKILPSTSVEVAIREFLNDYELIFLINLLAQRSVEQLKSSLPTSITLTSALKYFPAEVLPVWSAPTDIVGNTFELTDTSVFAPLISATAITEIPAEISRAKLIEAQNYLRLREYGRWLALRHISRLRRILSTDASIEKRYSVLPAVLTDWLLATDTQKPIGVSAGCASGELVLSPKFGGILVVSALTPDLAHHASILSGVIADHGGLLSHFAIIARELGLPVIVNYPVSKLQIGQSVTIDGATGQVIID